MTNLSTELAEQSIGKEKCWCGDKSCKTWWLTGIGRFHQGSGFTEQEADQIIAALKAAETPLGDVAGLVERLRLHTTWRDSHGDLNDAPNEAADAITALTRQLAERDAEVKRLREALIRLRDCDWVISLPDRMDAVRDIARKALGGDNG